MNHKESQIQRQAVSWFRLQFPNHVILSIPNGGARNKTEASILKGEGALAGAADLFIACPSFDKLIHGLWIETKSDVGKQTKSQKEFQQKVVTFGYAYRIIRSLDEFIELTSRYLKK